MDFCLYMVPIFAQELAAQGYADADKLVPFTFSVIIGTVGFYSFVSGFVARRLGLSPLVIGLTVVAFGTSAPELAVSTSATLQGNPGIALGNVVGSNVLNVLLILGVSAAMAPLVVHRRVVRWEVPFLVLVTAVTFLLAGNGVVSRLEGLLLVAAGITYTAVLVLRARSAAGADEVAVLAPGVPAPDQTPESPRLLRDGLLVLAGLGLLVLGSRWIVQGATTMAEALGVPDLVIGLTVVATGTSLPELATSVIASIRGERDMAVGNVIGSNLFNLMIILGTAAAVSPDGIPVPPAALTFDLPVMLAVALACLPIFFTGHRIDRLEGWTFLGFYAAYTVYLVLDAADHEALHLLRDALLFAIPCF